MLNLWAPAGHSGKLDRRELLRVGSLSLAGLGLPLLLQQPASAKPAGRSFGKAKNCILLYLSGGPAQLDTFDPKPDAPEDIRGEFRTIPTSVTGVRFSELLPRASRWMHRIGLVRTLCHDHNDHGRGSYWMFTGSPYLGSVSDVNSMSRADLPHLGSCVAKLAPGKGPMFPFVLVPHRMDVAGGRRAGQFAGALGGKYDPLLTGGNPNDDHFKLEHLPLAPNDSDEVLRRRLGLLDQLNKQTRQLNELAISQAIRDNQARALDVISSEEVRRAVDLASAKPAERERYGRNLFGQSVLLGKRLLEAGARLVQCNWQRTQGKNGFAWDTHWNNFSAHKEDLVPPLDQAFDAAADRPGEDRPAGRDAGGGRGRVRPFAEGHAQQRRPRTLAAVLLGAVCRRRHPRRPGPRAIGQERRLSRLQPDHPRRLHRHHLPLPRPRPEDRNPRPGQPTPAAVPRQADPYPGRVGTPAR